MTSLFKAFLVLIILLFSHKLTVAQQDCFDATFLCSSSFTQNNSYTGVGSDQEVAPGATCLGNGEVNSAWYRFTVNTSGSFNFQLNPLNPNDDYDFALFDLTNDSCSGILAGTTAPLVAITPPAQELQGSATVVLETTMEAVVQTRMLKLTYKLEVPMR